MVSNLQGYEMLWRQLLLAVVIVSAPLMANQQQNVAGYCEPESKALTRQEVKKLIKHTEPIKAPCCADMLHINGNIVLAVSVDDEGKVARVQILSGPPLLLGITTDSVKQWKFRPYASKGTKKNFCGKIHIHCKGTEHGVEYKIL